jgi:hypothetical protein
VAAWTIKNLEEIPDVLGDYPGEMRMSSASELGTEPREDTDSVPDFWPE